MRLIDADALIEHIKDVPTCLVSDTGFYFSKYPAGWFYPTDVTSSIENAPTIEARPVVRVAARPLKEWHEDYGDVLWWKFPIEEPPYVGSPLDCNWSGYHTHWTPIEVPEPPNGGADMRGDGDG